MNDWHVALDLSGTKARLAARNETTGVIAPEASLPMRGRDAARLAPWVLEHLAQWGIALNAIGFWTVGAGPGSFTGMRLAAAFVAGLTADRPEVRTRCVPTAAALAAAVPADGEAMRAVLYDGRNHEILVYGMRAGGGEWLSAGWDAILNCEQATEYFPDMVADGFVALATEVEAIAKVVPEAVMVHVIRVEDFSLIPLLRSPVPFDNDLTRLIYLRPAVFTK